MKSSFVSFILTVRGNLLAATESLRRLDQFLNHHFERYEIVVVCNGPGIPLAQLKSSVADSVSLIHFLQLGRGVSFETAALVGLDKAIGDFVYFVEEAKLDFPLNLLDTMMNEAYNGNDVVLLNPGLKHLDAPTRLFYKVFNARVPHGEELLPARVVLVSRRALNYVLGQNHLIRFHRILFVWGGFQTKAIPYKPEEVENFEIKSLADRVSLGKDLLIYYSGLSRNLGFFAALGFAGMAALMAVYAIYSHYALEGVASGWASLMLFLAVAFTGVFVLLGMIADYLQKILMDVQGTPIYNLRSVDSNFESRNGKPAPVKVG